MRSPGRPPLARREHRQRFWAAIERGLPSEDAAVEAGVSQPVGTRWFREGGGMPPIIQAPLSGRFLSFAEREEIAILHARGCGIREIARRTARVTVDDLPGAAPERGDPGGSLECRATTAQGTLTGEPGGRSRETRRERSPANLRARPARRHDHQARW